MVYKYIILCLSLTLNAFAARPFNNRSGQSSFSSNQGSFEGVSPSSGTQFGSSNTGFSSPNLTHPSGGSYTPIISIADGKRAISSGSKPLAILETQLKKSFINAAGIQPPFEIAAANSTLLNQSFYSAYKNKRAVNDSFLATTKIARNTTVGQKNSTHFQLKFSVDDQNCSLPKILPSIRTENKAGSRLSLLVLPKILPSLRTENRGGSRPSLLGLRGFTNPTIQNHNYLKSLQVLKGLSNEQPKEAKTQMLVIGGAIVLFIVLIIAMYPLLLKCK